MHTANQGFDFSWRFLPCADVCNRKPARFSNIRDTDSILLYKNCYILSDSYIAQVRGVGPNPPPYTYGVAGKSASIQPWKDSIVGQDTRD